MEKFGIFELLDALAAIAETATPPPSEAKEEGPPLRSPSEPPSDPPAQTLREAAVGGFFARHEKIARHVKR